MNTKFLILLFLTIFYNGVSHSTPIDGHQISDVTPLEEKLPTSSTVAGDHINKKVEPPILPAVISQNSTSQTGGVEAPLKDATAHSTPKNNMSNSQVVNNENAIQDAVKKMNSQVLDNNNKPADQPGNAKGASQPADDKNVTVTVSTSKNPIEGPVTTLSGQTTVSSTPTAAVPIKATTVKPSAGQSTTVKLPADQSPTAITTTTTTTTTTVAPSSVNKDIITEQNTPAPAHEKHFDGPSFIGGIVLTIGLTAIGFIAFKYYKSGKIDMNYRTL